MKFKAFWSENSFLVFKLIVLHVVMTIFGLMTYIPFNLETSTGRFFAILSSVITVIFYYYLINLELWKIGATDNISAKAGNRPHTPLKGLYIGLCAAVPDVLICYSLIVFWYFRAYEWAMEAAAVAGSITALWEGMFIGIYKALFSESPIFLAVIPFIPVFFAWLSYFLGTKEFSIFPRPDKKHR